MANHKSAIKRVRQNKKRRLRNKMRKTRIKNLTKAVEAAIAENAPEVALERLRKAQSFIDKIGRKKGTIHRRKAARKVSRLYKKVSTLLKTASS
ncbi:MAG: 30S ribosomal protein S20 [Thermodesulfobacteria bacterium]|nr:30S ribosomal protein S20 [Thermodesulfobacteriota bacterium]